MASCRRSTSLVHHDKIVQNGDSGSGTAPYPKQPRSRIYLLLREYGSPLVLLMVSDCVRAAIAGVFRRRSCRPVDRLKMKGQHRNQGFFHLFVFFILGIVLGFAPYLSGDVSKNFVSKHHAFSFQGDLVTASGNQVLRNMVSSPESFASEHIDGSGQVPTLKLRDETFAPSPIPYYTEESVLEYRKLLIIITVTNASTLQAYYLNRLAHILRNVSPSLLWIVVEMSFQSTETAEILRKTGIMYRHLICAQNVTSIKGAHTHQRNVALSHIEKHRLDGIVYFADADRIYSAEVFDRMREIRRLGTWPVAILAENKNKVMVEGPVCGDTRVIGWHTNQRSKFPKRFHVDVSGFAFNSTVLWDPKSWRRPTIESIRLDDTVEEALQVSTFIEQLVEDESQMEGLPNNCSKIMVWHLHLEAPAAFYPRGWLMLKNLEVVAPLT